MGKYIFIDASELSKHLGNLGVVIQGCGGDLDEWVDGINQLWLSTGIIKNSIKDVYVFNYCNLTNILFKFDKHNTVDMNKLIMWRLQNRGVYGSMWLEDYIDNILK